MVEKFFSLSKVKQFIIVAACWILMIGSFLGTVLLKQLEEQVLIGEVALTCLGMFFMVVSICISCLYIFQKKD